MFEISQYVYVHIHYAHFYNHLIMMHINAKAIPINDNGYIYHITVVELVSPIVWGSNHAKSCLTMPLVINNLGGRHTHKYTHTDIYTETIFKKPGACQPMAGADPI